METLEEFIKRHRSNENKASDFKTYLFSLIDKKGFKKDSDVYNKAGISRQRYNKVINGKAEPSLPFTLRLAFALELDNKECKYLLKKAGFTLASSSKFALTIRYFIENKIYNIDDVNEILYDNGFLVI